MRAWARGSIGPRWPRRSGGERAGSASTPSRPSRATACSFRPERSTPWGRGCSWRRFRRQATRRSGCTTGIGSARTESPARCTSSRALAATDFARGPVEPLRRLIGEEDEEVTLVRSAKFVLVRRAFSSPRRLGGDGRFHVLSVLDGSLAIEGDPTGRPLARGQSVLLPAALRIRATDPRAPRGAARGVSARVGWVEAAESITGHGESPVVGYEVRRESRSTGGRAHQDRSFLVGLAPLGPPYSGILHSPSSGRAKRL